MYTDKEEPYKERSTIEIVCNDVYSSSRLAGLLALEISSNSWKPCIRALFLIVPLLLRYTHNCLNILGYRCSCSHPKSWILTSNVSFCLLCFHKSIKWIKSTYTISELSYLLLHLHLWKFSVSPFDLLFIHPRSSGGSRSWVWDRVRALWESRELLPGAACDAAPQEEEAGLVSGERGSAAHHARGRLFYGHGCLLPQWVFIIYICQVSVEFWGDFITSAKNFSY